MNNKKWIRPSEVEKLYGIKPSTLSSQRVGNYGLPFHPVGRKPNKRRGGIILYNVEEIDEYLEKNRKGKRY